LCVMFKHFLSPLRSGVIEQVTDGEDLLFLAGIEGVGDLLLDVRRQAPAFASLLHHFVGQLFCGRIDDIRIGYIEPRHYFVQLLRAVITAGHRAP
jgi:hypothetical protein